jgi:hypothetical protein
MINTREWEAINQSPETRQAFDRAFLEARWESRSKEHFWDSAPGRGLQAMLIAWVPMVAIFGMMHLLGAPGNDWKLFWLIYLPVVIVLFILVAYRRPRAHR